MIDDLFYYVHGIEQFGIRSAGACRFDIRMLPP